MYGDEEVHTSECVWCVFDCEDVVSQGYIQLRMCPLHNVFGVYLIVRMV